MLVEASQSVYDCSCMNGIGDGIENELEYAKK